MRRTHSWLLASAFGLGILALTALGCGRGTSETPAEGSTGTAVGDTPPPFSLPDLGGRTVALSDLAGKVVVLDLWATWCPPCRVEVPFLVELYEEFKDAGLVVVGIGLDEGGADVLRPFVESNGVTYPILVGSDAIRGQYGVTGIPATFIIGRDGRIAAKHVGFHPSMADGIRAEVAELVRGGGAEA